MVTGYPEAGGYGKGEMKIKQVNIIGFSTLNLGQGSHLIEFIDELGTFGLEIISPALESINMEIFMKMTSASLNLVLSHEGLGLAQYMEREYAIPFLMHVPVGLWGMRRLIKVLAEITNDPLIWARQKLYNLNGRSQSEQKAVVLGEPLLASCIAACLRHDFGIKLVKTASLLKNVRKSSIYQEKTFSNVILLENENALGQWIDRVQPDIMIGDPTYQRLLGPVNDGMHCKFIGKQGHDYLASLITAIPVKTGCVPM